MGSERREPASIRVLLGLIAAIFLIGLLRDFSQLFVPFAVAVLFYFLFNASVQRLIRRRMPKSLVLCGLLLFIFILLYGVGLLIYTGASSFIQDFPRYGDRLAATVQGILAKLNIPLADVRRFTAGVDWTTVLSPGRLTGLLSATLGSFTSFIGNVALILLLLMFMLGGRVPLLTRVGRHLPADRLQQLGEVIGAIDRRVQRYLLIKTLMSVATAALAAVILVVGGIDFAILAALLVFFFNFIPTFGSILGTLFPVLVGLLQHGLCLRLVLVTASLMVMQFVMGNVVEPQIAGHGLDLSPLVILLSLIFWGGLWGVAGMFLAVPLTSALKIVLEQIPSMRVVAAAMSAE